MYTTIRLVRLVKEKFNLNRKIPTSLLGTPPINSTALIFKRLTPSEVKERKERSLCYYCDVKFSVRHKYQNPQLFMIKNSHIENKGGGRKPDMKKFDGCILEDKDYSKGGGMIHT